MVKSKAQVCADVAMKYNADTFDRGMLSLGVAMYNELEKQGKICHKVSHPLAKLKCVSSIISGSVAGKFGPWCIAGQVSYHGIYNHKVTVYKLKENK